MKRKQKKTDDLYDVKSDFPLTAFTQTFTGDYETDCDVFMALTICLGVVNPTYAEIGASYLIGNKPKEKNRVLNLAAGIMTHLMEDLKVFERFGAEYEKMSKQKAKAMRKKK